LEVDPQFPELGLWIIRRAIEDAKEIQKSNPDFLVHVNLSYSQVEKPDFVESVAAILKELDYPADKLCLEITERCRLLDMDLLKNVIVNLRGMGVLVALDDFGTGFSAIGLLKNLSFDIIKIDRSFVNKIEEEEFDRELIEHFTTFASSFKASVCVEGVETNGMRDILQHYPVESFQGYLYAKPLDFDTFIEKYKG
jgi:EAL domain-containing protein (putative c-di-GMP-specific phosphodiesterase class I)